MHKTKGPRYRKFKLVNFKGIDEITLDLDAPVTTLIGLNESGKTTILEGIYCFGYGDDDLDSINPDLKSLRKPQSWIPISQRSDFNESIIIAAVVDLNESTIEELKSFLRKEMSFHLSSINQTISISENYKFELSKFQKKTSFWGLEITGKQLIRDDKAGKHRWGEQVTLGTGDAAWNECTNWLRSKLPEIWYFPNFLFELPDSFIISKDGNTAEDSDSFYQETFERILKTIGGTMSLSTHVIDRVHSEDEADAEGLDATLLKLGRTITETVFGQWARIFGRKAITQEVDVRATVYEQQPDPVKQSERCPTFFKISNETPLLQAPPTRSPMYFKIGRSPVRRVA